MIKKLLSPILLICSIPVCAQTYIMSNTPITTCSGTYMDPGGTGFYADNDNFVQTICSGTSNCVSITFSSFSLESGFDYLAVYDGPSTSSPQISGSPFTGTVNPGTLTCSSGCMTFAFSADFTVPDAGWVGTLSCVTCPPPPPPPNLAYGWTQRASVPAGGRHRGTAITIGSRAYAGMGHINAITDILYDDWWEYDPGSNSWTQKANFPPGPRMHPTGFAIGNFGYVGTGRNTAGVEQADLWRYDPSTNSWSPMASMPAMARRGAVSFVVNGKGYVGTGSYSSDFWEYNPATNSWLSIAPFPGAPRIAAVAFSIGSKGYVGTGNSGMANGDLYEYNPTTNTWIARASMPGLPRMEAAAFSLNGKGYVGTGDDFSSGTNYQDFWEFDPIGNTWVQITDFSGSARRYMNCFTIGTRGYGVFGTSGTNYNDLWEYGNYVGFASVKENENSNCIKTFPNPFLNEVTFSISQEINFDSNASIKIMDISGKTVLEIKNIHQYEIKIERGDLRKGMYFFEFINNTTQTTGKFIAL